MKTGVRLTASSVGGLALLGLLLFLPAGTFNYWQAWIFIAVFTIATLVPTVYLARTNPAALQRRMRGAPPRKPERCRSSSSSVRFWGSSG